MSHVWQAILIIFIFRMAQGMIIASIVEDIMKRVVEEVVASCSTDVASDVLPTDSHNKFERELKRLCTEEFADLVMKGVDELNFVENEDITMADEERLNLPSRQCYFLINAKSLFSQFSPKNDKQIL